MMEPETKYVSIWVVLQQLCALVLVLAVVYFAIEYFQKGKSTPVPSSSTASSDVVQWLSVQEGEAEFQKGQKPILYDFTAEWCGFCKKMKVAVFDDKAQAAWINQSFIPVVVMDRRQETGANPPEIANLQSKYQVRGFPTLVVRYPGNDFKIEVGFSGRDNLLQFLHGALANSGGK